MSLCWLVQSRDRETERKRKGVEERAIRWGNTVAMRSNEQNRIVLPPLITVQIYTSGRRLNIRSEALWSSVKHV